MYSEETNNVTVSFTCYQNGQKVIISKEFNEFATWKQQAYYFYKFLLAQGYILKTEDLNIDDEDIL